MNAQAQKPRNKNIAIFDLDGCVSDDSWRADRLPARSGSAGTRNEDYTHYHDGCDQDAPLAIGSARLKEHILNGDYIFFLTARPVSVDGKTCQWLIKHFGIQPNVDFMIVMRAMVDHRRSVDIKRDMLEAVKAHAAKSDLDIVAAYDDLSENVAMFAREGVRAFQLDAKRIRAARAGVQHVQFDKLEIGPFYETSEPDPQAEALGFPNEPVQPIGLDVLEVRTPVAIRDHLTISVDLGDVPSKLEAMAATFRERNAIYVNNAEKVGRVMKVLFPHGVTLCSEGDHHIYHLFELMIVKLTRFTNSGLTHEDSIHDLAIYAAMIEPLVAKHEVRVHAESEYTEVAQ